MLHWSVPAFKVIMAAPVASFCLWFQLFPDTFFLMEFVKENYDLSAEFSCEKI